MTSTCGSDQRSDRIDSFWFANFDSPNWVKINKKANQTRESKSLFDLWFTWANHFIFDSDTFWFTFEANESHWFILIRFWFVANHDPPANHDSPVNQNQIESKIKGRRILIHSLTNWFSNQKRIKVNVKIFFDCCFENRIKNQPVPLFDPPFS